MSWSQLVPKITILAREGLSADDIGKALDQHPKRIERIARKEGIRLAGPGGTRFVQCHIRKRDHETLVRVAGVMGLSPAAAMQRISRSYLDRSMQTIMKDLGKEARPKRRYTYRNRKPKIQAEAAE
jgi:hypothetical protein